MENVNILIEEFKLEYKMIKTNCKNKEVTAIINEDAKMLLESAEEYGLKLVNLIKSMVTKLGNFFKIVLEKIMVIFMNGQKFIYRYKSQLLHMNPRLLQGMQFATFDAIINGSFLAEGTVLIKPIFDVIAYGKKYVRYDGTESLTREDVYKDLKIMPPEDIREKYLSEKKAAEVTPTMIRNCVRIFENGIREENNLKLIQADIYRLFDSFSTLLEDKYSDVRRTENRHNGDVTYHNQNVRNIGISNKTTTVYQRQNTIDSLEMRKRRALAENLRILTLTIIEVTTEYIGIFRVLNRNAVGICKSVVQTGLTNEIKKTIKK